MIKNWKNNKDDEPLPKFPEKKQELRVEVLLKISDWTPSLVKWFMNKSEGERQLIVFEAYRIEKLREVGCTDEEIKTN
jgi:hypothetical protein